MGLTQQQLADGIGVSYQRVNELINGKRGITPSTALRPIHFYLEGRLSSIISRSIVVSPLRIDSVTISPGLRRAKSLRN